VSGPGVDGYLFGAEAKLFLKPSIPTKGGELVDLEALRHKPGKTNVVGWIFGGIAATLPNFGPSTASNELFAVVLHEK
jgi:hypothetical protein